MELAEEMVVRGLRSPPGHLLASKSWQPASFVFWTKEDCEYIDCDQNNPFCSYVSLAVPTDPLERSRVCTKLDLIEGTCTYEFPMSGQDALLVFGRTIDDARYFNFILNQLNRWDGAGGREDTRSSIGLGINHLTLKHIDEDPFDARFAMIVTASTTTSSLLKDYLIDIGIPPVGINEYLFHRDFANGYLGEYSDHLGFLYRISCSDEAVLEDYMAASPIGAYLIRTEPAAVGDVDPMEEWDPRPDPVELGLEGDLWALIREILIQYWPEYGWPHKAVLEGLFHIYPEEECRGEVAHPEVCNYDNPDALYITYKWSDTQYCRPYLSDDDDFVIIAGVNHGLYQIESYFSYFLYRESDMAGFTGFWDLETIGSALQYWPEAGDRFFAHKLALNCQGDPWCHEIPTGELGLVPGERFFVSGRIYLDPVSKTGPDPNNFLPSILLWYQKTP